MLDGRFSLDRGGNEMSDAREVEAAVLSASPSTGSFADRWIFVFSAGLLFFWALAGFVPDSFSRLAAIDAGERAPFSVWVHFHAVAMGAWLSLLLTQAILMATGNGRHHRKLGTVAFILIPIVLFSFYMVVTTRYGQVWNAHAIAPPEAQSKLAKAVATANSNLLSQLRAGGVFAVLSFLAIRARRADSDFHKRMILIATMIIMGAATNRVPGLPTTMPGSLLSLDLWGIALILPLLIWDFRRSGRVHPAFVTGFAIWIAVSVPVHLLWGSPWWQELAPKLMGYA